MNWLETETGKQMLSGYLTQFKGKASQAVYRSDISQFFDFFNDDPARLSESVFHDYTKKVGGAVSSGTVKRKFSALNRFFKFMEGRIPGFQSPLGKSRGHLQTFAAADYSESDLFRRHLDMWDNAFCTESTKNVYKMHVRLFFQWCRRGIRDVAESDFIQYRDYLRQEGLKISTVWVKFVALNRFFSYISKHTRLKNPFIFRDLKLIPPKKDSGYYDILTQDEIRRIFDVINLNDLIGKRDYCIIRLMIGYALRVNEICRLKFKDIERERHNGKLRIWIRDRKGRIGRREDTAIILEGKPLDAFDDYLSFSDFRFMPDTRVFLPMRWDIHEGCLKIDHLRVKKGRRRDTKTIRNRLDKYMEKADIRRDDRHLSCHSLRHTALTELARAGVNLIDLRKLAAHQDVSTTLIYTRSVQMFDDHVGMKNPLNFI